MKHVITTLVIFISTLTFAADKPATPVVPKLTDAQKVQALLIYKAQADKLISRLRLQLQASQQQLQAEQTNNDQSLSLGIQELYSAAGAKPEDLTFNFDTLAFTPVEKKEEPKKDEVKTATEPEVKK